MSIVAMVAAAVLVLGVSPVSVKAEGDAQRGQRIFRTCAACHTFEPGRHLTGPSLAGFWGRKAGTIEGFSRYSAALKGSGLAWNEETLDPWLKDPQALIPGNRMTFRGIRDAQARRDLIEYLKVAGSPDGSQVAQGRGGMRGGGMMRAPSLEDLKKLGPDQQVVSIRYCRDTYHVTTAAGESLPFWEFNLRLKTDSSDKGPAKGKPALLSAGMMGDRAFLVFSDPAEISGYIKKKCEGG